jgi:hypothetical protein
MSISLQTFMPSVVTPNTQVIVTDIDGDGKNEVIMLDSNLKQLSVCHQFSYSEISLSNISSVWSSSTQPLWPSSTALNWITTYGAPALGIPTPQGASFSPWQIKLGDEIMVGDFDGDGHDELFIYNLTTLAWGILKWQSNGLQTICNQSAVVSGPFAPMTWQGSVNDQYFVVPNLSAIIPNVPANSAGILLYNSQTFAMGMLSYSAGSFTQCWSNTGTTLPGWNLAAKGSQPATNKFYPGYFVTAGVPTIVVYNPSDAYIGLMVWNSQNQGFEVQSGKGHQVGNFSFGWTDELQAADLDGDGLDEIFIFSAGSGGTSDIGILKLVSGSFQQLALSAGTFGNQPNQWTTNQQATYLCLSSSGGGVPGKIYCYSPGIPGKSSQAPQVGMLYYSNKAFSVAWSGSSLLPNNGWPVTAADSIYAGPARDSAIPNLITLSNQGPASAPVLTLGGAGWTGQTPSASGQVQLVSSQKLPIQSWSPATLASNAPATAFTPFPAGNQTQIYTYISQLFPIPSESKSDGPSSIRSVYDSTGDSGKFESYASALAPVKQLSQIPGDWPALPAGNNWTNQDWLAVQDPIVHECNQVDTTYKVYGDIGKLAADLALFQKQDLGTVKLNIKQAQAVNPKSELDYWLGEIFVTLLCALAASTGFVEGLVGLGVFLSTAASVAGAVVGYNPTQSKSYAEAEAEQDIVDTTSSTVVGESIDITNILTDPIKLKILDKLHDNEWKMKTSLPSTMKQPFQSVDRVWMYQQLLPFYFSIEVYQVGGNNLPNPNPTYAPPNTGLLYFLKDQNGYISASQFGGTTLFADLFTTLAVTENDFFAGNGGWSSIQRTYFLQSQNNSGPDEGRAAAA